jgi:lysophospholipase L1-like esterase
MEDIICVFGDSTAWGAWDLEKGGWVNRLWLFCSKRSKDKIIYNLSVSGGTTETILSRFEKEAKTREVNVLIFQSGGNDAAYRTKKENFLVPTDKFRENVTEIIKKAKAITDRIVFVGFKNVDESRTNPVSWADVYYTNKNIENYNKIMKEVCQQEGILFLDVFGLLTSKDLDDGLHPNSKGHERIFKAVKDFLDQNKII